MWMDRRVTMLALAGWVAGWDIGLASLSTAEQPLPTPHQYIHGGRHLTIIDGDTYQ